MDEMTVALIDELTRMGAERGDLSGVEVCVRRYRDAFRDRPLEAFRNHADAMISRLASKAAVVTGRTVQVRRLANMLSRGLYDAADLDEALILFKHVVMMVGGEIRTAEPCNCRRSFESCAYYIESHLDEALSLSGLAARYGYSPSHFSRKFKERFGVNPSTYILNARLDQAAAMLEGSDLPVSDISRQCRFGSQSHFHSQFQERYGTTPRRYRLASRHGVASECGVGRPTERMHDHV